MIMITRLDNDCFLGKLVGDLNNSLNWKRSEKAIAVKAKNNGVICDVKIDIGAPDYPKIYTKKELDLSQGIITFWQVRKTDIDTPILFDIYTGKPYGITKHRSPAWGKWLVVPYLE